MANKVKILDGQGTQVFPITHVSAVIDNSGNSVEQVLGAQTDLIHQAQLEVGAVPSDLTPTKDSSNWVTSDGIFKALNKIVETDVFTNSNEVTWSTGNVSNGSVVSSYANKYKIIDLLSYTYFTVEKGTSSFTLTIYKYNNGTWSSLGSVSNDTTYTCTTTGIEKILLLLWDKPTDAQAQAVDITVKTTKIRQLLQNIDNAPTEGSDNLVTSGGVQNELALGAVYDVSAHNSNATFASLSALLSDANLSTLIPTAVRKGGMSIKYIQSHDNKYMQYRLMSPTWSTVVTNWVLSELPIENTSDADLEFSDNDGNILARYKNGHHETKNWSSDKSQQNTGEKDYNVFSTSTNYAIGDIVLKGGLLYKFTSEHEAGDWDGSEVEQTSIAKIATDRISEIGLYTIDTETGDFEISDNYGNVIFRVADGHARTKHFDSRNIPQGNVNNASYKFACLGDSITSNQTWNVGGAIREVLGVTYLQESISDSPDAAGNCTTEFGNLAVGNATMSDWSNTTIQLTKDSGTYYDNNVVSNQVRRLLQHTTPLGEAISWVHPIEGDTYSINSSYGVGKGFVNDKPDIILIAAGTNDWGGNRYIDTYDTVIGQSYSQLDRLTVCSALRWAVETLQINYPYAKIFVETPICRTTNTQDIPTKVKTVAESIRKLCKWLGVQIIDANYYSGVGELTMKSGWMTPDGTHPNEYGKRNISLFVAGQIKAGFGRLV